MTKTFTASESTLQNQLRQAISIPFVFNQAGKMLEKILLQWDRSSHRLVSLLPNMGIDAGGDVRDVFSVQTAKNEQLIFITKNNDNLQVIRRNQHL